ncbi:telomere length regulation protein [Ophiostoma piceae UAMH 11346]|uniref:Telomere length regulation protein n=1 Tax=Ophiostoma piceae (strain UAMH 11346) TaxID=1262450 RepID=S3BX35_OPHP1|nr:telomere length regulation protein [Ophiostoma piceae UAMH 11346]
MDALLSPVSTTYTKSAAKEEPFLQEVKKSSTTSSSSKPASTAPARQAFTASSADEALEILKNEPDYDTLVSVLRFLLSAKPPVDVRKPTHLSAQLVQVFVTAILPNYWTVLREEGKDNNQEKLPKKQGGRTDLELLIACLRSVTGLSSLSVRLRALLAEAKTKQKDDEKDQPGNPAWQLRVLLEALSETLASDDAVAQVWSVSISGTDNEAKNRPLQQEFLNIIGSGKIVSLAAEAEIVVKEEFGSETLPSFWVANGKEFSLWMTRNIIHWALKNRKPEVQRVQGALLGKALRLGYLARDSVISTFVADLILGDSLAKDDVLASILEQLPVYEQKKMLNGILKFAADTYFSSISVDSETVDAGVVSAVAGLVEKVIGTSTSLRDQLVSWLLTSPGVGLLNGIGIRRAAVAAVSKDQSALSDILEKSMAEFGDQLFIKHSPMMQQEAKAQIILLSAAYVGRYSQRSLASLLRSRTYLSLVTNRLGSSQNRAKFLGMAVGEALSGLVDDNKQKLDFHMEEMNTDEAKWYKGLAKVNDSVGKPDTLKKQTPNTGQTSASTRTSKAPKPKQSKPAPKPARQPPLQPKSSGFIIEELNDDDDDDDDLRAYEKPDSDTEDSDDDPTLVRRDKPKAPVYIRDLISFFRDTENYDKQKLALTTAPPLIRRKATFGTEVQQHAQDLASILISLQDTFDIEDFGNLRLQGMVALAVAQPKQIGPYYALTFFEGDYSLSQRASVLSALGLGARELAGFDVSEYAAETAFPTKQLPNRVEHLYVPPDGSQPGAKPGGPSSLKALGAGALDSITDSLTASFLRPIAAKAADEATGPDVLKLASFKSRLKDVSSGPNAKAVTRKKQPAKGTVNTSSQLLASSVFFPLISRFQLALQASSSARLRGVLFEPSLLSLYIKTLAVVLHAAGPSALALPDMTAELWNLLLSSSVQAHCVGDLLVTHAVLFALMAVLDVNENRVRELCRDLPREVVQTRDWALQIVENMRMAGAEVADQRSQESEVQMLAAGTYIRLSEGMESYKSLLLGEMIG